MLSAADPASAGRLNGRILLAEDNEDHQPLLSHILSKAGAQVTLAENGKVAVELAQAAAAQGRPFDLVLTDIQMPVLDGFDAMRKMRSDGFTGPIIALTAQVAPVDCKKCFDAGCDDYLSKPVGQTELVNMLADHLAR